MLKIAERLRARFGPQPQTEQQAIVPIEPVKTVVQNELAELIDPAKRLEEVRALIKHWNTEMDGGPLMHAASAGRRLARLHAEERHLAILVATQPQTP